MGRNKIRRREKRAEMKAKTGKKKPNEIKVERETQSSRIFETQSSVETPGSIETQASHETSETESQSNMDEDYEFNPNYTKFAIDLIRFISKIFLSDTTAVETISEELIDLLSEADTTFCIHVGQAILAVAKVNRLNFKLRFDEHHTFIFESLDNMEEFVSDFVVEIYGGGYSDQFLIVHAFMIDLFLYLSVFHNGRYGPKWFEGVIYSYERVFCFYMEYVFMENGGWQGLKWNIRPWWVAFRKNSINVNFLDAGELFSPFLTKEVLSNYQLKIHSSRDHFSCEHFESCMEDGYEMCLAELKTNQEEECREICLKVVHFPKVTLRVPIKQTYCEENTASSSVAKRICL